MQAHLDTIPVLEAMEQETDCPLCYLYAKVEASEVERALGGSVMEPDQRIRVNQTGFCKRHHQLLFQQNNRLGHALMTDTHAKETLQRLEKVRRALPDGERKGFFAKPAGVDAVRATLLALTSHCVLCENVEGHMARYLYTFVHLWAKDADFRAKWEAAKGVCLPHALALVETAQKELHGDRQNGFCRSLLSLVTESLQTEEKELEWFTLKFDYRNQDKPWGNSKDALERTANRLRGRCLSD